MKILVVHCQYRQPGGEDRVFHDETALLRKYGHDVVTYTGENADLEVMSRARQAATTVWNRGAYRELRELCGRERPDVAHFHNTFALVSPAAYHAVGGAGVPLVQTLHNYRLECLNGLFFRDGGVCEDCLGRSVPWPGVLHACYRQSRSASGAVALMLTAHRRRGTWTRRVARFIAPTDFTRRKLVAAGLPPGKMVVKPHFVAPDPGPGAGGGDYALYVGRLSEEKGIRTLLNAWQQIGEALRLLIVGDGPLASEVVAASAAIPGISWLGAQAPSDVLRLMGSAACLVFPSECYETFGRVVIEAFSRGTPVLAAGGGAASELVTDGVTGRLFDAGDADALADRVRWLAADPVSVDRMRVEARRTFEQRYTAERNHDELVDIYRAAACRRSGEPTSAGRPPAGDRTGAIRTVGGS